MKLLLDTHLLLWAAEGSSRLSPKARAILNDSANELHFSALSIWEIALKSSLGKAGFEVQANRLRRSLMDHDYVEVPLAGTHAVAVTSLPWIHKDPFDRALIAQATVEGITLLTTDATIAKYAGPILKV